jgi:hypothetical protein
MVARIKNGEPVDHRHRGLAIGQSMWLPAGAEKCDWYVLPRQRDPSF